MDYGSTLDGVYCNLILQYYAGILYVYIYIN